jgi:hypothetical protein
MSTDSATRKTQTGTVLRVVDALDHPHGGRILRVRLLKGEPPTVRRLRGSRLRARGPQGQVATVKVLGFAVTGGKVSNQRLQGPGRADLHVEEEEGAEPVSLQWELYLE